MTDLDARIAEIRAGLAGLPKQWHLVWWGNEQYPYPLDITADNGSSWIARDGTVSSPEIAKHVTNCDPQTVAAILADRDAHIARAERMEKALREIMMIDCRTIPHKDYVMYGSCGRIASEALTTDTDK